MTTSADWDRSQCTSSFRGRSRAAGAEPGFGGTRPRCLNDETLDPCQVLFHEVAKKLRDAFVGDAAVVPEQSFLVVDECFRLLQQRNVQEHADVAQVLLR